MVSFILTLTTIITTVFSNTFICNEPLCDFGTCTTNQCNNNTYICTSNTNTCSLNCEHCNNITLISSSNHTQLLCNKTNSCTNMTIQLQTDPKLNTNSFVLQCSDSLSCTNIKCKDNNNNNIPCNSNIRGPIIIQNKNTSDDCFLNSQSQQQCVSNPICSWNNTNNKCIPIPLNTIINTTNTLITNIISINHTQMTYFENNNNEIQKQNEQKSTAVILIIFVILFWCLVCLCVPIYINRWRQKMLPKDAGEGIPQIYNQNNINIKPKPMSSQIKDGINENEININNQIPKQKQPKIKSTHRRVLSDSMMARIVNNKPIDSDYSNDSNCNSDNDMKQIEIKYIGDTMVQSAEDMMQCVYTNESGELVLNIPKNINHLQTPISIAVESPNSVESVPSQILLNLPRFDSNKAQKLSLSPTVVSDMTNEVKLPKLSTSIGSINHSINTIQISIMSPSNFSPPENINENAMDVLSHLSTDDLELLYTQSEVNEKLYDNGDYVD